MSTPSNVIMSNIGPTLDPPLHGLGMVVLKLKHYFLSKLLANFFNGEMISTTALGVGHSAKRVDRGTHSGRATLRHFCYPLKELQFESRATLKCFAQHCLTLSAEIVLPKSELGH